MAGKLANVTVRIEPELKKQAEDILDELGISVSSAITQFYKQIVFCGGLPFRSALPRKNPFLNDAPMTYEQYMQYKQNFSQFPFGMKTLSDYEQDNYNDGQEMPAVKQERQVQYRYREDK